MLLVDYRAGSKELIKPLLSMGLPVKEVELDAGDIAFCGRGPAGAPVEIGIEYKHHGELLDSMRTGRLQGHQLEKMQDIFDIRLIAVEGELLYDAKGALLRRVLRKGRAAEFRPMGMSVAELYKRLTVLWFNAGVPYVWHRSQQDTLKWLEAFYRTWTDKDQDEHLSHLEPYIPAGLTPLSEFRRVIGMLPSVGYKLSAAAETRFKTIERAVIATPEEWAALETDGRKFGMKRATKLVEFIRATPRSRRDH